MLGDALQSVTHLSGKIKGHCPSHVSISFRVGPLEIAAWVPESPCNVAAVSPLVSLSCLLKIITTRDVLCVGALWRAESRLISVSAPDTGSSSGWDAEARPGLWWSQGGRPAGAGGEWEREKVLPQPAKYLAAELVPMCCAEPVGLGRGRQTRVWGWGHTEQEGFGGVGVGAE